ncbi:MAG: magnesium transporter [Candidatus Cyclobacteriaceae bacterium M3_2C_046]
MKETSAQVNQNLINSYFELFPREAALTVDAFPVEKILHYLKSLPPSTAKEIFARLNPDSAVEVMQKMNEQLFIDLFTRIDSHLGARWLSRLDQEEAFKKLALLPTLLSRELKEFMTYKPDSAGYLMETEVTSFYPENTIQDVLRRLRKLQDRRITSVYIIDEAGTLLGELSLQLIALSLPEHQVQKLIQPTYPVNVYASREEVVDIMEKGNFFQIPVTDVNSRLIGVIRNEALINATKQEVTEDIQAMFGASREEQALSKISVAVKSRLPWLHVNLATAFLASMIVGLFEDTIAKITILAVFLPVVAGQSGNTGSQALAVTMRGLALREIRISQWFRVARKELMVGFVNGVVVALVTSIIVYIWASSIGISLVIGTSMIISMMIAGFSGAVIPVILKALGQDPATSSSIILTTVTDICGFLSFLGLATIMVSVLGIT